MNNTIIGAAESAPALSIAQQIERIEILQKLALDSRVSVEDAKKLDAHKQILMRKLASDKFAEQALHNAKPKSFKSLFQKLIKL